ncbi:hypothetical protein BC332_16839 [Capsicum chinense]|nr:hypothetical protein BC332_16839 [Capsicum chinense]
MALPSAFRERVEQMEQTRNERLSLLRSEEELQHSKSQHLASRFSNITSIEQRCLKLDRKIASQYFTISSLKSKSHQLHAQYLHDFQKYRDLKDEVEELEEIEKEKLRYYSLECGEMEKFKEKVGDFMVECQLQLEELRKTISSSGQVQGKLNHSNNTEIATVDMRKKELADIKENLEKSLALNYQVQEQLTKQLVSILMEQSQEKK